MQRDRKGDVEAMRREEVESGVLQVIERLSQDWELDEPLTARSRIVADLGFESIDLIQLVVALEQHFGNRRLGFNELLMTNGRYVDDLSVAQIVDFLAIRLV
jgi:acyl carrier protein